MSSDEFYILSPRWTREQLEDLTGKRFKRVTDQEDDIQACEACGCEPHPTGLGLRVVGEVSP